jgi:hypothetical protein
VVSLFLKWHGAVLEKIGYAPERHEHTGRGGGPIRTEITELTDEELLKIASGGNRKPTL